MEEILHPQLKWEGILQKITTQIYQRQELAVILTTTLTEVCQIIEADRLVIYQFDNPYLKLLEKILLPPAAPIHPCSYLGQGKITYEALKSKTVASVLNSVEGDDCFVNVPQYYEKYQRGFIQAVNDTEITYAQSPCLLSLMQRFQIRAKLVTPIVVKDQLWGLLIAHHHCCWQWTEVEKHFLWNVAERLAIAIYQHLLYSELQQQKQILEQQVIERTQELRDALQAAEAANQVKSAFLAMVSHELRTPLTSVIGMASTLLRWGGNEGKQLPWEKQQNYLQMIQQSGKQLLEVINDILMVSQLQAGRNVLQLSDFSLSKLSEQMIHRFQEDARDHEIRLFYKKRIKTDEDQFRGDQRRIKHILLNLLNNAIKFTPSGGKVLLRVWRENQIAVFQIEDTGIGIAKDECSNLFQTFRQLDSSYRRQYAGLGLGLALTKQLVELHEGTIEVESEPGVGSTFTVRIPSLSESPQPFPKLDNPAPRSVDDMEPIKGCIVLMVEEEESATLICDMLTAAEYQVVWMVDGATAIRQFQVLKPVATIVDLSLLGSDEIIRHLKADPIYCCVKILALVTPEQWLEERMREILTQVDRYLEKPVRVELLLNKIAEMIGGTL